MKSTIATSPSQSQRLIACGVDPKTADMCWRDTMTNQFLEVLSSEWKENLRNLNYSPAWSTSRLLSLLPMTLVGKGGLIAKLQLEPYPDEDENHRWCLYYFIEDMESSACYFEALDPIEACVKAIEWLTKEGYKLNEIEE